jgi:hypothetical protein
MKKIDFRFDVIGGGHLWILRTMTLMFAVWVGDDETSQSIPLNLGVLVLNIEIREHRLVEHSRKSGEKNLGISQERNSVCFFFQGSFLSFFLFFFFPFQILILSLIQSLNLTLNKILNVTLNVTLNLNTRTLLRQQLREVSHRVTSASQCSNHRLSRSENPIGIIITI